MEAAYHHPVLLAESIDGLAVRPDGVYVDVTFGGGGHSREILRRLGPEGKLYAFDQDRDAAENALDDPRFMLIGQNFRGMKNYLRFYGVRQVDGILADLGVSSHQFDTPERGFTIRQDGPLDMRMNVSSGMTAADVVNTYSAEELSSVLYRYGELKNSRGITSRIVASRPLETTGDLVSVLEGMCPKGKEHKFLAQVFQALRIEVNHELEALGEFLIQSCQILKPGGRLSVISYHSLEDRMVKNYMRSGVFEGEAEKDFFGRVKVPFRIITRKAIVPSQEEIAFNHRARSARLRIAERMEE